MSIPKHFINLLGAIVVVGILIAGVALVALPLYGQSRTIDAQTRTVAQSNDVYQIQATRLAAEKERFDEISASIAERRGEIAAIPQLDDVFEVVLAAAELTEATIESITASEPEPWIARAAVGTTLTPAPTAPAAAVDEGDPADADAAAAPASPVASAPEASSAQRQVPVNIRVTVEDAARASAFIDALGDGARLLAPVHTTYSDGSLTVSALAFIRTGD